jgi:hypothetical protein
MNDGVGSDEVYDWLATVMVCDGLCLTRFFVGIVDDVLVIGKVYSQLALQSWTLIMRAQTTPL